MLDGVDCSPVEDPTDNVNGATLLGTGLKNEVGEYNCFLNVIIQVGLSFLHNYNINRCTILLMYYFPWPKAFSFSVELSHCGI